MEKAPVGAWVYVLRLRSGQLYVGATTDLERRWREHVAGNGCRTTKLDPPTAIVCTEGFATFPEARQREAQIKRWSRAKREAPMAGDTAVLKRLAQSHDHQPCRRP